VAGLATPATAATATAGALFGSIIGGIKHLIKPATWEEAQATEIEAIYKSEPGHKIMDEEPIFETVG
jgi:hypothetical protein